MIIIFSKHALERMQERPLNKGRVEAALNDPDNVIKKSDHLLAVKRFDNRVVLVAYREIDGMYYIITAISSSKTNKYLKK